MKISELHSYSARHQKKLVRITLGNISNQNLIELVARNLSLIDELNIEKGFYLELGGSAVVYTI